MQGYVEKNENIDKSTVHDIMISMLLDIEGGDGLCILRFAV